MLKLYIFHVKKSIALLFCYSLFAIISAITLKVKRIKFGQVKKVLLAFKYSKHLLKKFVTYQKLWCFQVIEFAGEENLYFLQNQQK